MRTLSSRDWADRRPTEAAALAPEFSPYRMRQAQSEAERLAQELARFAEGLEERFIAPGVVRRAAGMLVEMSVRLAALDAQAVTLPRCLNCGTPLSPQAGPGRPRRYCSRACRGS